MPTYLKAFTGFQGYLSVLRRPEVSDVFKRQLKETGTTTVSSESIVQPIRATLYFKNVEGFGEWRILLPTGVQECLREARRSNVAMFENVMKKIKQVESP